MHAMIAVRREDGSLEIKNHSSEKRNSFDAPLRALVTSTVADYSLQLYLSVAILPHEDEFPDSFVADSVRRVFVHCSLKEEVI